MYESDEEVAELQALLDRSYAEAGRHLLSIHAADRRVPAVKLCELLTGMCVLDLATVSSKGEPVIAPIDGVFYGGRWYFGSSRDSVRARHIGTRPAVSVAHTRGEALSVTTHGIARELDKSTERADGYRQVCVEIYSERLVDSYWNSDAPFWELEPKKMFALAAQI